MNSDNKTQNSAFAKPVTEVKTEPINYLNEIRQMMHGFGDSSEPLVESAKIIEDVVLHQMRTILEKASQIAENRGKSTVTSEDFIFLLRKDKVKLQRLIKYLELRDFKSKIYKSIEPETTDTAEKDGKTEKRKFETFLNLLDTTGHLMDETNVVDQVKHERCIRADAFTKQLDEVRYLEYCKARRASFANTDKQKFNDWIGINGDLKVCKQGCVILSYLAYETVAQIVDFALLVRQDQMKLRGDSIDRLQYSYCNPITYKPYQHNQTLVTKPITPSEIYEALRRYWSPQMDMTGPFYRCSMRKPHLKLLAC